jgi:hypothetical protein
MDPWNGFGVRSPTASANHSCAPPRFYAPRPFVPGAARVPTDTYSKISIGQGSGHSSYRLLRPAVSRTGHPESITFCGEKARSSRTVSTGLPFRAPDLRMQAPRGSRCDKGFHGPLAHVHRCNQGHDPMLSSTPPRPQQGRAIACRKV